MKKITVLKKLTVLNFLVRNTNGKNQPDLPIIPLLRRV